MLPPGVLGLLGVAALRLFDNRWSGLFGLLSGLVAAPGLLVAGAPFGDDSRYGMFVLASIPLWLLIGLVASRRATRAPIATWADYWREYAWLAGGVVVGVGAALAVASAAIGDPLV